jgi:uncharacterized membrane protein
MLAFRSRGSMSIAMILMLLGLMGMLGLIEVGYLYWAKRDTQKVADLAALAGAQRLQACAQDDSDNSAARGNAVLDNGFGGALTIQCGSWDPAANATADHFAPIANGTVANAVKVTAAISAVPFLHQIGTQSLTVQSEAVAAGTPSIAAFSVGSQLLELQDSGLVPSLLKLLGLDVGGTALVGYNGLANLRITPAGLLKELGIDVSTVTDVGTLNSILAAKQISIGTLLDAMVGIGEQQQLAQVSLDALNTLIAQVQAQGTQLVQLGTDSSSGHRGLFASIEAADVPSALNVQVSALDLVNVGLDVANSHHLVNLAVPIPGVSAWVTVIEPPSIAIGGVGVTAYTAQVRVRVNISTAAIPVLGPLLSALGTNVNIPLILDVTNGKGELTSLCDRDSTGETATIDTQVSLLNMCVGKFDDSVIGSTSQSCDEGLQNEDLVTALGTPLISGKMHIPALTGQGDLVLHQGETGSINANLNLGDTVSNLVKNVLQTVLGDATGPSASSPDIAQMTDQLWNQAGPQPDTPQGRQQRMQMVESMLTQPISPETSGLLPGLANLVGGLLNSVGNLLGNVLGAVTGDGCTTTLLGFPGGNVAGCKAIIKNTLSHSQAVTGDNPISNALLAPVALLLDALRPALNAVGEQFLQPLLTALLGEQPGRVDVHLMSLQCHRVQLVY